MLTTLHLLEVDVTITLTGGLKDKKTVSEYQIHFPTSLYKIKFLKARKENKKIPHAVPR